MNSRQAFLYRTLMALGWLALGYALAQFPLVERPTLVVVEQHGDATFKPLKKLDDGWYLVEVKQKYTCPNPLPLGNKELTVVVPHLVRMRASELEKP